MAKSTPGHDPKLAAPLIRAYLASLSPAVRKRLKEMQALVREAAPGATEAFSYGIPGFRLNGEPLVWCAAFTRHTSLYPMTAAIRRAHAAALAGYEMSTGT